MGEGRVGVMVRWGMGEGMGVRLERGGRKADWDGLVMKGNGCMVWDWKTAGVEGTVGEGMNEDGVNGDGFGIWGRKREVREREKAEKKKRGNGELGLRN
ncbi:uncharacterized protein G2W53_009847 [Senna tora]|uniref:Uncharacterized protein n=1 Tax=Senna tora TaxID=362788 RepID=A0A834WZW7_9FABA|nr:uncharacterized protein G2W53_009847 [Senna tora]